MGNPGPRQLVVDGVASLVTVDRHDPLLAVFDSVGLFWVSDYLYLDGRHLLTDQGNGRLISVHHEERSVQIVASPGRGPGEVLQPSKLSSTADTIAIADVGNGRIAFFSSDGTFIRSAAVDHRLRQAVALEDGSFLVLGVDGDRLTQLGRDGSSQKEFQLGRSTRPSEHSPNALLATGRRYHGLDVLAASGSTAYLGYSHDGAIIAIDIESGAIREFALPESTLLEVASAVEKANSSLGTSHVFSPIFRSLEVLPDGRLLAAVSAGEIVALVLDLASGSVVEVRADDINHPARHAIGLVPGPSARTIAILGTGGIGFAEMR